jgi:hypothetical protein
MRYIIPDWTKSHFFNIELNAAYGVSPLKASWGLVKVIELLPLG